MKKITKVLLLLGVLMLPAGLSASAAIFICSIARGGGFVVVNVPFEAAVVLEAHGWGCCLPPDCTD